MHAQSTVQIKAKPEYVLYQAYRTILSMRKAKKERDVDENTYLCDKMLFASVEGDFPYTFTWLMQVEKQGDDSSKLTVQVSQKNYINSTNPISANGAFLLLSKFFKLLDNNLVIM